VGINSLILRKISMHPCPYEGQEKLMAHLPGGSNRSFVAQWTSEIKS